MLDEEDRDYYEDVDILLTEAEILEKISDLSFDELVYMYSLYGGGPKDATK